MDGFSASELGRLFAAVEQALEGNRQALNAADPFNANHGDHMVSIFQAAAQAAQAQPELELPQAMQSAADRLETLPDNDSARLYAAGLQQLAAQFQAYGVTTADLIAYVRSALAEKSAEGAVLSDQPGKPAAEKIGVLQSGQVLKALMSGLAAWGQVENGRPPDANPLDMGTLFEFGMAYLQAKQRGGTRLQVLADAACAVSPLSRVPHRAESGRLAIQALLLAMQS